MAVVTIVVAASCIHDGVCLEKGGGRKKGGGKKNRCVWTYLLGARLVSWYDSTAEIIYSIVSCLSPPYLLYFDQLVVIRYTNDVHVLLVIRNRIIDLHLTHTTHLHRTPRTTHINLSLSRRTRVASSIQRHAPS